MLSFRYHVLLWHNTIERGSGEKSHDIFYRLALEEACCFVVVCGELRTENLKNAGKKEVI